MTQAFLPFALPEIGEEEINEIVDSLRSGWITTGPKTKRFEADFAALIGPEVEAMAVNSATAGLHLALEACGIGPGDEVILPTYTFTATAEVIRYMGATPVMVDVLPETFNIDPQAVQAAITPKTKMIMPVHFAGLAVDMEPIFDLADQHGLKVVEDAAHALPCTYNGEMIGNLRSDAAVFSFYANKTMTTGEGGMVVTKNPEIAKRCRVMRLHGISKDAFDRYSSTKPAWYYEVVAPGFKYNMPDLAAALGIHQLQKLPAFQKKREQMAQVYDQELSGLPLTLPQGPNPGDMHSRHLYPVLLDPEAKYGRDDFIAKMSEHNIGCSVHFIPLHLHPYWQQSGQLSAEQFPVAQQLFSQEVSIPLFTKMTPDDQTRVIEIMHQILD